MTTLETLAIHLANNPEHLEKLRKHLCYAMAIAEREDGDHDSMFQMLMDGLPGYSKATRAELAEEYLEGQEEVALEDLIAEIDGIDEGMQ